MHFLRARMVSRYRFSRNRNNAWALGRDHATRTGRLGLGYSGDDDRLETRFGDSMVTASLVRGFGPASFTMDILAGAWAHLFFGVLFVYFSDPRADRASRNLARR